jgi:hypothetical protein
MRVIIIESTAYKISEKLFEEIQAKCKEIRSKPYYSAQEMDISDYLDPLIPKMKIIGIIAFDFRL